MRLVRFLAKRPLASAALALALALACQERRHARRRRRHWARALAQCARTPREGASARALTASVSAADRRRGLRCVLQGRDPARADDATLAKVRERTRSALRSENVPLSARRTFA